MININSKITKNGIKIKFNKKNYELNYSKSIWSGLNNEMKGFLLDNISFLSTFHLPLFFDDDSIKYNTSEPLLKNFFKEIVLGDIPNFSDIEKKDTSEIIKKYYNMEFYFENIEAKLPKWEASGLDGASINFTFGKESLLTFGVCREIGIETELTYFHGSREETEFKLKKILATNFKKKFNQKINFVKNTLEYLNIAEKIDAKSNTNWGYGNQLTEYTLASLPLINHNLKKFILLGNEKSCNNYYFNQNGYKTYPVFDQSVKFMVDLNNIIRLITNENVSVFSIVEPLNEIAIMKILHNRYPDVAKFQFSCFPDNINSSDRWCHYCTKCARIYLFFKAIGIDPKLVGFKKDLFSKNFMNNFSIFNGKTENAVVYDYSGLGRDEQLFAFYLAYRNGQKGKAIELFKKRYLNEAKQREDELINEFFGIFEPKTIPKEYKSNILSIYKEELENLF
ncbi:MAG: hypothetical protein N3D75_01205 [Candidatus Aenigmarchaeota archaeon]|nr:hypothetical protein [Candidatus Aenigmarchaeota archaeon]